MRRFLLLLALSLGAPLSAQENRLWTVDLELEGPLEEVVLDCGASGSTRLRTGMVAGERRGVAVPVPARVPLGLEALMGEPLPACTSSGAGRATVLGWSAEQPAGPVEALTRLRVPRLFLESARLPGAAALALALAAFVAAVGLRRRALLALAVGAVGGLAAAGVGLRGAAAGPTITQHEAESITPIGVVARSALDRLPLPHGALQVVPEGGALRFDLALEPAGVTGDVLARGAALSGLETERAPDLRPESNGFARLEEFWVRSPGGAWSRGGAWPVGAPQPRVESEGAPPGWASAGLPPGRGVLIGRLSDTEFVRLAGFPERD